MLDSQRYQRAKSVFFEACEQPHAEREVFVERACEGDPSLCEAVRELLANDDRPLGMIDGNGQGSGSSPLRGHLERLAGSSDTDAATLPRQIGRYRVLSRLGSGGMGVVYLAEQENPRRQVALKVIAHGQASRQMLRRFEHEAQILGRLHHPGIAQVYEAGMHDSGQGGQPFFAMELVRGRSLLKHCEDTGADLRERLRLFVAVCEAVQHAHQQGVIHRDLKPANILVEDAQGTTADRLKPVGPSAQPKILDFGVARLTDSDVQATTMHTQADQLIGTVAYMSPEQMSGKTDAIDTRSDVYALGVILFELLAGRLPHDVAGKTIPDMIRTISDAEPTSLSSINRSYRGDLETIAGKAMERDKSVRYQSAGELAAEVQRYLDDEPIQARPPSTIYHFRKFARRNKALVGGAAAVLLALVGGIITTTWQARQAIAARDKQIELRKEADDNAALASAAAQKATAANDFLSRMLASASPDVTQGRDVLVSEVLDAAARELQEGALDDQPDVQIQVCMTIGGTYQSIGRLDQAQHHYEQALQLAQREPGRRPEEEAAALTVLGAVAGLGGNFTEAARLTSDALRILRDAFGMVDREDIATCLDALADCASSQARQADAIDFMRQALEMSRRIAGGEDLEVARRQARLAGMLHDPAEAEPMVRAAMATFEKQHGQTHPSYVTALRTLADTQTMRSSFDEAIPTYRRALELGTQVYGRDHHRNLLTLENLSFCLQLLKDSRAYADACDEMIRMWRQLYDVENMRLVELLINRGDVRSFLGQQTESEADYREAAAIAERLGMHNDTRACMARLSAAELIARRAGDLSEARALAQSVLDLSDQFRGQQKSLTGQAESQLGEIALLSGDLTEAERLCLEGYDNLGTNSLVRYQRYIAAQRLVRIYQSLQAADPDAGHDLKAAEWRQRQAELMPTSMEPATTPIQEGRASSGH